MKRLFSAVMPMVLALFVAGCMGSGEEVSKSAEPGLLQSYAVRTVDVAFADKATINDMIRWDNPDDAKVAADIKANVDSALKTELKQYFTGKTTATLKVRILNADVRTGAGHVLGHTSYLQSEVTLLDSNSGAVIRKGVINSTISGKRGTGNIGIIVAMASNAGTTLEQRYRDLAVKFANDIAVWAN